MEVYSQEVHKDGDRNNKYIFPQEMDGCIRLGDSLKAEVLATNKSKKQAECDSKVEAKQGEIRWTPESLDGIH